MTGKKLALEELLQGFLKKFGDSEENRVVIADEIRKCTKSKKKISIQDLDELEETLLYKLTPIKKQIRRFSLSPIDPKPLSYPSPTLKNIKPAPDSNRSTSIPPNYPSPTARNSKYTRRDSQLFPSDQIPDALCSKTTTNYLKNPSPTRKTIKFLNDQWGKIAKAEGIKFQQEEELRQKWGKEQKIEYWMELEKQVKENKKKQEKIKNEKADEVKAVGNRIVEYQSLVHQAKVKKIESKTKEKQEYQRALDAAKLRKIEKMQNTKSEKELIDSVVSSVNDEIKGKIEVKEKISKEVEAENINLANYKRQMKDKEKIMESQKELIHLMKVEKDLLENETRFKEIIKEKIGLVHDESRLLKVYPGHKTLKDYEEEANQLEKSTILQVIQEEQELKLKKLQDKAKIAETVSGILDQQVKESEQRKTDLKNYIKEQGEIWKQEDEEVKQKNEKKKAQKKMTQRQVKAILDKQVEEKEERENNELKLTDHESRMNSKIYNSARKVLGEDE